MSEHLTLIGAQEVRSALVGNERNLIDVADDAYRTHSAGLSHLPSAEFLRFPNMERERIIAKQGYLGGECPTAGIKWIASFPDNVANGMPRASALMILNSVETGRPTAVLEGSLISAHRTAASAALGARLLHRSGNIENLGIVGCGFINAETVRYIRSDDRPVKSITLFDVNGDRTKQYAAEIEDSVFDGSVSIATQPGDVLANCDVVSFATTAVTPTVDDLSMCSNSTTILHISLRDLTPRAILQADNITDDIEHVLQADTSLHLAEQQVGHHDFIRGTLADVSQGLPGRDPEKPSVFSPFGLAVLDLAFAEFVRKQVLDKGQGFIVEDFLP